MKHGTPVSRVWSCNPDYVGGAGTLRLDGYSCRLSQGRGTVHTCHAKDPDAAAAADAEAVYPELPADVRQALGEKP